MHDAPSEISHVLTLNVFYEELTETADEEGFCLPWYKTYFVHTHELRRFRSELTLPGLRLSSSDGLQYFIPETKFMGIAQHRNDAENRAAGEACEFLKTFTQRPHLIASEWRIDNSNSLYQNLVETEGVESSSGTPGEEIAGPSEGHHILTIRSTRPPIVAPPPPSPVPVLVQSSSVEQEEGVGPSQSRQRSTIQGERAESSGRLSADVLTEELHLLRKQIEILTSLVDRREPLPTAAPSSILPISSTTATTAAAAVTTEVHSDIQPA